MKVRKIESLQNENLKRFIKNCDNYSVFEGEKLVTDIINRKVEIKIVIAGMNSELPFNLETLNSDELWFVSKKVLKKLSSLKTAPGIIAVIEMKYDPPDFSSGEPIICLDNIQDPGNMGTLFRCAAAFGIRNVALSGKCVNLNNRKFIRAAQDSFFSLRIGSFKTLKSLIEVALKNRYNIYLSSARRDLNKIEIGEIETPFLIVIGSEGSGIDDNLLSEYKAIVIEQTDNVDSLNAGISGCIIMNEIKNSFELLEN